MVNWDCGKFITLFLPLLPAHTFLLLQHVCLYRLQPFKNHFSTESSLLSTDPSGPVSMWDPPQAAVYVLWHGPVQSAERQLASPWSSWAPQECLLWPLEYIFPFILLWPWCFDRYFLHIFFPFTPVSPNYCAPFCPFLNVFSQRHH